jgi:hypothetical protein
MGLFTVLFIFKGLKTRLQLRKKAPKFLKVKVRTPSRVEDIGLSIPHRILVILLRRKLLVDHDTVDSLLKGTEYRIKVRPESADEPLFFGLKLGRQELSEEPMSTSAIHEYLKIRAQWAGFSAGVSFYSWRTKALTTAVEASGMRMARMLAAHHPDGTEIEEYYDQELYQYDVIGIMLHGSEEPQARQLLAEMES